MQALSEQDNRYKSLYGLLGLFLFILFCSALGSYLMQGLGQWAGEDYQNAILKIKTENSLHIRYYVRLSSIVSQVTTFLLPALMISIFLHRNDWTAFLKLHRGPSFQLSALGVFFLFATFPIAQWLFEFNKSLPLPDWAVSLEQDLGELSNALLVMESPSELIFNLITIAVVPALAEELLFRGVLQQKIRALSQRPHFSIWLAALIFSAVHGQFEGFLARLLLGAALGYLLYWTNNLWIPIIAHFFNNGIQVVLKYYHPIPSEKTANLELSSLLLVVSIIFTFILGYLIINYSGKTSTRHRTASK
ncbi:MAG: type II CAAX endopeptidase family protein [Bacteroidota bacterium]